MNEQDPETIAPSTVTSVQLLDQLSHNPLRQQLKEHSFFNFVEDTTNLTKSQVALVLNQWFHPLHRFPDFLAALVQISPDLPVKTHVSQILWQELGQGDPQLAHEKVFIRTMIDAGFDATSLNAPAMEATERLVECYLSSARNYFEALGVLYGTEVTDLDMVAAIGKAVSKSTGKTNLPWVDIHTEQEPEHVESATKAVELDFSPNEHQMIVQSAQQIWSLWIDFFQSIHRQISQS